MRRLEVDGKIVPLRSRHVLITVRARSEIWWSDMPEARDKNGPPSLRIEVRCCHEECGHSSYIEGQAADRIANQLWAHSRRDGKLHIREMIASLTCQKCDRRYATARFELVYRGDSMRRRQQHDRRQFLPDEWG